MNRRILFLIVVLLSSLGLRAQVFEYGIRFDSFFDNREATREFGHAQTLGGARFAIDGGTVIDSLHRIRLGVDGLYEFGTEIDEVSADVILYYGYEKENWRAYFGAFPRRGKLNYPVALINDTVQYYRPNLEGGFIEYNSNRFCQNLWIDWDGARGENRNESFNAGLSGELRFGRFFIQDYILMSHLSGTWQSSGVVDNGGVLFTAGYDFSNKKVGFHGRINSGIIGSYYRYRSEMDEMEMNAAFYANLNIAYRWIGTELTLKTANKLDLFLGETYYTNAETYIKADVIFRLINKKRIKAKAILGFQYADKTIDSQQRVLLSYVFHDL